MVHSSYELRSKCQVWQHPPLQISSSKGGLQAKFYSDIFTITSLNNPKLTAMHIKVFISYGSQHASLTCWSFTKWMEKKGHARWSLLTKMNLEWTSLQPSSSHYFVYGFRSGRNCSNYKIKLRLQPQRCALS